MSRNTFRILLAFIICLCALPSSAPASAEQERVVRVGYYENDTFQAGAADDLVKTGYSYEYLQRLQLYTNWRYEYVYGEYGELYDALVAGEIDLLTGLAYKEERTSVLSYPALAMGNTPYTFLKLSERTDISSAPATIAGKRIGALDGAMLNIARRYLDTNGITAEIVVFTDLQARDRALASGEVDITIVESIGTGATVGIEAFADAGAADYFIVVAKDRPDILAELNAAQSDLFAANPDLRTELNTKWMKQNVLSTTLTENERSWITDHPTLTVGYYNDFLPYSDTDASGASTGIVRDVVPELLSTLGITSVDIVYRGYDSYDELLDALNAGLIDILFPVYSEYWTAERYGIMPTDELIGTYFDLVYAGNYPDRSSMVLALPQSNLLLQAYASVNLPGVAVRHYASIEACLDAVASGEASATVLNSLRTSSLLLSSDRYSALNTAQIATTAPLGFATRRSDSGTVELLNHTLGLIASDFALTQTYRYQRQQSVSFLRLVREYWWAFAAAITAVAAVIILVILRELSRSRRFLKLETQRKLELEEANADKEAQLIEIRQLNLRLEEASAEQEAHIEEVSALNSELEERQAQLEEAAAEQEAHIEEVSALNAELQRTQRIAEEANAAKTSFLFNMSHDIRTPMNAILGFRDLLEKHQNEPDRRRDYLRKIEDAGTVLLSIINNVLEMARIEKGTVEIDETAWSAEQFNDTIYSIFHEMMQQKGIRFTRTISVQNAYVYCDPIKLREVFINILSNAYKYTNPGGSVHMLLEEVPSDRPGYALYQTTISDTGIGMSADFLPHIFEEFSRESNTTDSKVEGTGLGMPIVKKLLDLMEGTIEVRSEKGVGSTFIVRIPHRIAQRTDLIEHAGVEVDPKLFKGKRILLAEDNELNAEIAIEILSEAGFIVDRAEDGTICVEKLRTAPNGYYDLILMDIQMPHMNGYEATRTIRALGDHAKAGIKILAMTANAFEEDKREAIRSGMNGHLAKPINVHELMKALAAILG